MIATLTLKKRFRGLQTATNNPLRQPRGIGEPRDKSLGTGRADNLLVQSFETEKFKSPV